MKKLFIPDLGVFREIQEDHFFASLNGDIESRGGVMSRFCSCHDMTRDPRDLGDTEWRETKDRSRVRFSDTIKMIKEVPLPGVLAD